MAYNYKDTTSLIDSVDNVATITTNTTLDENYQAVFVDATSGAISVTLPNAATAKGKAYHIKKIDSSNNTVTIIGTIDGVANRVINTQYMNIYLRSNGTAWYIL